MINWTRVLAIVTIILAIIYLWMAWSMQKSLNLQLGAVPNIELHTNRANNFIDLRYSSDGYKDYLVYIYNSGKAPCFDLEIKNIKYASVVYKVLNSKEVSSIGENYTQTNSISL